ncbi:hypothetical protein C1645_881917 [Glomus cerebriforme]|uniref:Uncharacterized protein n=1 Tax=Glomus cerebriforme TaxID=658196 RepID=A0A397S995_9GLOM|nr:hypothetical protein C1645_881917 [Glomus cerebriforme]
MARLNNKHFIYKEDLGGLYSECNECEYQVFANIKELINTNITNLVLWNKLVDTAQNLRHYFRRSNQM